MPPVDTQAISYVIVYLIGLLSGIWVPAKYAMERLEGFGRWAVKKFIPYEPPPGKSEEEAMMEASNGDDDEEEGQ